MALREVTDPSVAAHFLAAGVACARNWSGSTDCLRESLAVAQELLSAGDAIPPVGVLVDLVEWIGCQKFDGAVQIGQAASPLPATMMRRYDDYVLGRIIVDAPFDRAAAAVSRYRGAERTRAIAYLWKCIASRTHFPGTKLNPALVRLLLTQLGEKTSAEAIEASRDRRIVELLIAEYEALIHGFRTANELIGPEDLFELEHGTAVRAFGQRLALRQTLQAAAEFEAALPLHPPESTRRGEAAPTAYSIEDHYPVGGFSSLSTRGSVESLLHSQLAFMEREQRPDLFDIKYVREELLYYSRDDNQFTRPRHTCVFAFASDLSAARVKDRALPFQRIVLLCGLVVTVVRTLKRWLTAESLEFRLVFLRHADAGPIELERDLLSLIFEEEIAQGLLQMTDLADEQLPAVLDRLRQRSHVTCSVASTRGDGRDEGPVRLVIDGPNPCLEGGPLRKTASQPNQWLEPLHSWHAAALDFARSHLIG